MYLRRNQPAPRRGIILLVVLAMLTLFAIAGITFVLYANAASESARINRDAETFSQDVPDMDPNQSFNYFMSQLVYGVSDDNTKSNFYSALRGHSLAETMYGSFDAAGSTNAHISTSLPPSDAPFNGTGRLHEAGLFAGADGYNMVNYTYYFNDAFCRDPGRVGSRAANTPTILSTKARGAFTGGQNAPYTYPDLNNMFLATIRASDGTVLQPSFHRDYATAGGFGSLDPSNANWTNPSAATKYLILRPRPAENQGGFPLPKSNSVDFPKSPSVVPAGDVKNLVNSPGGYDSIWIDIGAPELTTAAGLRYKMLVAPLILDLDNRINLNAAGNILASNNGHASNQGSGGPWDINIGTVLNKGAGTPPEWANLFTGNKLSRYGLNGMPDATFTPPGVLSHLYAQTDYNSTTDPAPNAVIAQKYSLPALNGGFFPGFPGSFGNGATSGANSEYTNGGGSNIHPVFFNPFNPVNDDQVFSYKDHASLMWAGISASQNSALVKLCPTNFSATDNTTISRVHQTTTLSMDLDRPGAAPFLYDPSNVYNIAYNVPSPGQGIYSTGPPPSGVNPAQTFPAVNPRKAAPALPGEFDPYTWRSTLPGILSRLDLNRPLTNYTGPNANAAKAASDRQQFATDIFLRLVNVTGMAVYYTPGAPGQPGTPSTTNVPNPQQYATLRWLAQLSANIVDFIDTDDVMTAFQWAATPTANDTGYVFGTELPKLVVNEVYLEYDNDSGDPNMVPNPNAPPPMIPGATKPYHMNVWAELLNPLPSDAPTADANNAVYGTAVNNANLVDASGNALYQIVITTPNKDIRNAGNVLGDPDGATPGNPPFAQQPYNNNGATVNGQYNSAAPGGQVLAIVNSWGGAKNVAPAVATGTQSGPAGAPPGSGTVAGFLVIGPNDPQGKPAGAQVQMQSQLTVVAGDTAGKGMTYSVPNVPTTTDPNVDNPTPPTILLQRLANPNAAFNGTPGAGYNPWITVDYVDMQQVGTAASKNVMNEATPPQKTSVNDARQYYSQGTNPNWTATVNKTPNGIQTQANRFSFGRNQPYGAVETAAAWQEQVAGAPAANPPFTSAPTTSFFDVNGGATAAVAPDWLVHIDRPLIGPIELLNVSGFKPHELTQQFYNDGSGVFQHVAPWVSYETTAGTPTSAEPLLLYRLLEFVKVKNMMSGVAEGGRVPGKININTIDPSAEAVFQAMADAQAGNTFTGGGTGDVHNAFTALMAARMTNATGANAGVPASGDQPFWGMAMGPIAAAANSQYPTNRVGINNTLLNGNFNVTSGAATHPYQQMELLNKIFNNCTTRSNTFAVWLTVGFFQITDDTTLPMKLGPEINAAQGRNIRHHMFAIVDRTQLQTFNTTTNSAITAAPAGQAPVAIGLSTTTFTDARTSLQWQIYDGATANTDPAVTAIPPTTGVVTPPSSILVYEPGTANEETVVVQAGFKANFNFNHVKGAAVISRGNPGPMPNYNVTSDGAVVPYSVIID